MMFAFYWIRITESKAIMSSKLHLKANEITTDIINNVIESHWYAICLFKFIYIQKLGWKSVIYRLFLNITELLLTLVLHLSTVNLGKNNSYQSLTNNVKIKLQSWRKSKNFKLWDLWHPPWYVLICLLFVNLMIMTTSV